VWRKCAWYDYLCHRSEDYTESNGRGSSVEGPGRYDKYWKLKLDRDMLSMYSWRKGIDDLKTYGRVSSGDHNHQHRIDELLDLQSYSVEVGAEERVVVIV
jgi:hypothetical protein